MTDWAQGTELQHPETWYAAGGKHGATSLLPALM